MKPLKLRTRHMPTKITKPPKKGKGAEYNRPQQKKNWKNESVVVESPDGVDLKTRRFSWSEGNNHAFGYFKGKFYYGEQGNTHYQMMDDVFPVMNNRPKSWRNALKYPGRVWVDKKLFSLWQYPTNLNTWKELIADLSKATKQDVRKTWSVEMAKAFGKNVFRSLEKIIKVDTLLKKMEGTNKPKIAQHSKDTQNLQHLKSPVVKGTQFVPVGLGSKKTVAGLTATPYHQKRFTSDGVIKLGTLIESILKVHRIKRLVEGMIREVFLGGWPHTFVIGPDSKVVKLSGEFKYHGDALRNYPLLMKKALSLFDDEKNLKSNIDSGSIKLYRFMYDEGFIRGGDYWIAFDSEKVPQKSLMVILQLAKEGNKKFFEVDDNAGNRVYSKMTVDEFIEAFL